ncbi:hypothetical protein PF004_g25336 [Phytophthora fragariae]|uniref:Uncharacterized protein n=1 Tax=Phytophthora fragariae TaxID=53985 RepID=A0A6G0MSD2_9STRA|nr:hypothetical protein PF004_g25336 [Phytophthora fragariae]
MEAGDQAGVFHALQAIQLKKAARSLDGLIYAVTEAFRQLPSSTIDKCFVTLQKVMQCVIAHGGGNNYPLPRVRKQQFQDSKMPVSLEVEETLVDYGLAAALSPFE